MFGPSPREPGPKNERIDLEIDVSGEGPEPKRRSEWEAAAQRMQDYAPRPSITLGSAFHGFLVLYWLPRAWSGWGVADGLHQPDKKASEGMRRRYDEKL
ncbi:hypothetical protein Cob_v002157 [Colletotrichum orbiculare MAFF 240422]|uniref:Uncharacterized protein n=1 Tax=Colletotrichum orbiculare (strain 104-T / ATCC 96160 / CBS 514.97 / LARS 414 / MAFF 240422) TaxID=1213857 RepID=A0A484G427_COLOR|nr:hypothetical protein Cob_v002157 [Colletotrichum orbiculare MAFF 240422]